jgi:hypothetical protein
MKAPSCVDRGLAFCTRLMPCAMPRRTHAAVLDSLETAVSLSSLHRRSFADLARLGTRHDLLETCERFDTLLGLLNRVVVKRAGGQDSGSRQWDDVVGSATRRSEGKRVERVVHWHRAMSSELLEAFEPGPQVHRSACAVVSLRGTVTPRPGRGLALLPGRTFVLMPRSPTVARSPAFVRNVRGCSSRIASGLHTPCLPTTAVRQHLLIATGEILRNVDATSPQAACCLAGDVR